MQRMTSRHCFSYAGTSNTEKSHESKSAITFCQNLRNQNQTNFSQPCLSKSRVKRSLRGGSQERYLWLKQKQGDRSSLGREPFKKSLTRPLFCRYFRDIRKKRSHWPGAGLAVSHLRVRGSTITIISAYVPGQHMWASGQSSSSPKQRKSDGCVNIYNSVSARSPLTKSKKKQIIESAAI